MFEPIYTPWPNQLTKIIRYPGRAARDRDQGVGAHKDGGFVTILLQDKVAGLQVEGESGWIDALPVPGTFIINIGEILEIASNGYLRANLHRVVSPPAGGERLSVAFFLGAHLDARHHARQLVQRGDDDHGDVRGFLETMQPLHDVEAVPLQSGAADVGIPQAGTDYKKAPCWLLPFQRQSYQKKPCCAVIAR